MGRQKRRNAVYVAFAVVTVCYAFFVGRLEQLGLESWRLPLVVTQFIATILALWMVAKEVWEIQYVQQYVDADDIDKRMGDRFILKETCRECGSPLTVIRKEKRVFKRCDNQHVDIQLQRLTN